MRSSAKGTLGSMVSIERVRKSSGGIDGMFMFEKERAAFRRARRLEVRLDLKADLKGRKASLIPPFFSSVSGEASNTLKSSSSVSSSTDSGCSSLFPGGEDTGVSDLLVGCILRPLTGVWGVPTDESVSVEKESVNDGIDCTDS